MWISLREQPHGPGVLLTRHAIANHGAFGSLRQAWCYEMARLFPQKWRLECDPEAFQQLTLEALRDPDARLEPIESPSDRKASFAGVAVRVVYAREAD